MAPPKPLDHWRAAFRQYAAATLTGLYAQHDQEMPIDYEPYLAAEMAGKVAIRMIQEEAQYFGEEVPEWANWESETFMPKP